MNTTRANAEAADSAAPRAYRPRLSFYHPNAKGTGCALQMEVVPAECGREGAIMATFANQSSVGDMRGEIPRYPRFDWENRIVVKLGFMDLSGILQVLRGECESIGGGKGLYHRFGGLSTRIVFRHALEPFTGYSFEVYRSSSGGSAEEVRAHFLVTPCEATGLERSISGSMAVVCFGVPGRYLAEGRAEDASPESGGADEAA